jgi:hypothetical protein
MQPVARPPGIAFVGRAARMVRRIVTAVLLVIAALAFTTSFGNGWNLALRLGVPNWISPLITPAVDLSVAALIVSIQYVRSQGMTVRLLSARLLLLFNGITTLVINIGSAVVDQQYGRAAFDAIAPLLLIFWGEVGPGLLVLLHSDSAAADEQSDELDVVPALQDNSRTAPDEAGPSAELVARARELDTARRIEVGRPISRDRLRAALGISNGLASELVRIVRSPAEDGEAE